MSPGAKRRRAGVRSASEPEGGGRPAFSPACLRESELPAPCRGIRAPEQALHGGKLLKGPGTQARSSQT